MEWADLCKELVSETFLVPITWRLTSVVALPLASGGTNVQMEVGTYVVLLPSFHKSIWRKPTSLYRLHVSGIVRRPTTLSS